MVYKFDKTMLFFPFVNMLSYDFSQQIELLSAHAQKGFIFSEEVDSYDFPVPIQLSSCQGPLIGC